MRCGEMDHSIRWKKVGQSMSRFTVEVKKEHKSKDEVKEKNRMERKRS